MGAGAGAPAAQASPPQDPFRLNRHGFRV